MTTLEELSTEEVREALAYAGLVLVAFELVKSMIVKPIKFFYAGVTFGEECRSPRTMKMCFLGIGTNSSSASSTCAIS